MSVEYVIDRLEGDIAVCENDQREQMEIEVARLPNGAREGSTIIIGNDGLVSLVDGSVRESRIADKMKTVWR